MVKELLEHWKESKKQWSSQYHFCFKFVCVLFKDTHREKTLSNETPALTKGMNIDISVVGTSN